MKFKRKLCMKTAILSLALLLLASCQDNKKEQLLHLVQEWQGKEIRFPEKPVFTRFVTDTTASRLRQTIRSWSMLIPSGASVANCN